MIASSFSFALSIAGCDPSSFAGFSADLRTFGALGVHGLSVVSTLTAQSPRSFDGTRHTAREFVRAQIRCVLDSFGPLHCKIGLVPDDGCLEAIASELKARSIVVDPVMGASADSGLSSLPPGRLAEVLFPMASLVTPNIPEAEALLSRSITSIDESISAATEINERYGCSVLLKGGHFEGSSSSTDVFCHDSGLILLKSPREAVGSVHGSGCFLSASITGHLALGFDLPSAVQMAKDHISRAFADPVDVGGFPLLNVRP